MKFVSVDSFYHTQQFFSYVWTGLPGLNKYQAEDKVSCSRTQCSASGEAQTSNPTIESEPPRSAKSEVLEQFNNLLIPFVYYNNNFRLRPIWCGPDIFSILGPNCSCFLLININIANLPIK